MEIKEKIYRKIKQMKKYIDFLKSRKSISLNDLRKNYELKSAIERNFHLAIESALDIGEIIISAENLEKPEDYRGVILILGREKILPEKFSKQFADSAGFRNILVHLYDKVDIKKLYNYLQNNLKDFNKFNKYIAQYYQNK
ncbi:MAG: DUF86 domain-containing protein [Candidatus Lokiarchaeota archaeon]|nr:DUF86 domain-containing protein [Candidatus Lokiarchaeota archaeon]